MITFDYAHMSTLLQYEVEYLIKRRLDSEFVRIFNDLDIKFSSSLDVYRSMQMKCTHGL